MILWMSILMIISMIGVDAVIGNDEDGLGNHYPSRLCEGGMAVTEWSTTTVAAQPGHGCIADSADVFEALINKVSPTGLAVPQVRMVAVAVSWSAPGRISETLYDILILRVRTISVTPEDRQETGQRLNRRSCKRR
jgi:hypothetical protein